MESLIMFISLVPALLLSETVSACGFEMDGIYLDIYGNNLTFTFSPSFNKYRGVFVVREILTYYGVTYCVTDIEENAFYNCSGLAGVSIGNSVTGIGNSSFYNCNVLTTSINISNSVTTIDCMFRGLAVPRKSSTNE